MPRARAHIGTEGETRLSFCFYSKNMKISRIIRKLWRVLHLEIITSRPFTNINSKKVTRQLAFTIVTKFLTFGKAHFELAGIKLFENGLIVLGAWDFEFIDVFLLFSNQNGMRLSFLLYRIV